MITAFSNIHLASALAVFTAVSIVIFLVVWVLLNGFYSKTLSDWPFINRIVLKMRGKGERRLVKKYGLFGLSLLIAIPLPTLGVFGGTTLSWLMGMKFWSSLAAVITGATISNSIILISVFGIRQTIGLFG